MKILFYVQVVLLALLFFVFGSVEQVKATSLFGVSGDGAIVNPESFFDVSTIDASTILIQGLGNGDDGESIAFNPSNGLMYHWSGIDSGIQIMETIDLNTGTITNITQDFSAYNPGGVRGSTYDASSGNFLVTDRNDNLSSVTPGGDWSTIGPVGLLGNPRGIAFNGGILIFQQLTH